ncbi:MAG: hypothetical protein SF097_27830 [Acidobacteriota bacterium]|nr:hypothetical protein [Acidobacteriota bacterium]
MSTGIHTQVTFVTKLFNTDEEKDYFINPICFGDDLAKWLLERLDRRKLTKLDAEPIQEDWGWCFSAEVGQRDFLVCLGPYEDDSTPSTWLVFVESRLSWFGRKLLGHSDESEMVILCSELDRVLHSESQISHIRWYTKENFINGDEDDWKPHPNEETK